MLGRVSKLQMIFLSVAALDLSGCRLDVAREPQHTQALQSSKVPGSSTPYPGSPFPGPAPAPTPPSLSAETVSVSDVHWLRATGGRTPYSYSIISGDGSVDPSTGVFSAAPLAGTTDIRVTDANGLSANATITTRSWAASDEYTHSPFRVYPSGGLSDSSGNLYVLLNANDTADDRERCLLRKSTNQGATWSTVLSYRYNPRSATTCHGIALDQASGTLFLALGGNNFAEAEGHALVMRSVDGGSNWSTIMNYITFVNGNAAGAARAIVAYSASDLVVGGKMDDASLVSHWFARKSIDGGASWATTDDFLLAPGKGAELKSITKDPSGNLYASGTAIDASDVTHFIVRKSTDRGYTWVTVDNYVLTNGRSCGADYRSVQSDALGNVYAAAYCRDGGNRTHWIIRKSSNAGASWSVVDDFTPSATQGAWVHGLSVESNGQIYASGGAGDGSSGSGRWYIRKSGDQGSSWSTVFAYQRNSGINIVGYHVFWDPAGNRYIVGSNSVVAGTPESHGLILKLAR